MKDLIMKFSIIPASFASKVYKSLFFIVVKEHV